jgi:nitronate monooxygenase
MPPTRRDVVLVAAAAALSSIVKPAVLEAEQRKRETPLPTPPAESLMKSFGLKYPIFEAPHGRQTCPDLAIAVSEAGAMGALASLGTADEARASVLKVRSKTQRPFVVNYILATTPMSGNEPASLRAALEAGAPIVQFSWGMPSTEAVAVIRTFGARMGVQVTSAESARAAFDLGADYVVCQGTEAGGHVQATRPLYEALPLVLQEARGKPVVASGGIGDGHGVRAALLHGASGAMLGTRFVATVESNAHATYKQAILAAGARDTALTNCFQDGWPAMHRALRNRTFSMWDAAGCPPPGKRPGEGAIVLTRSDGSNVARYWYQSPVRNEDGAIGESALYAGESVGLVKDLPKAGELVARLWRECVGATLRDG